MGTFSVYHNNSNIELRYQFKWANICLIILSTFKYTKPVFMGADTKYKLTNRRISNNHSLLILTPFDFLYRKNVFDHRF